MSGMMVKVARKIDGCLTYSSHCGQLISDDDFSCRKYPNHNSRQYLSDKSPFEKINISMITQVPLDCMHLVELGVMRKILIRLMSNKVHIKLSKHKKINMSNKFISMRKNIPKEFS